MGLDPRVPAVKLATPFIKVQDKSALSKICIDSDEEIKAHKKLKWAKRVEIWWYGLEDKLSERVPKYPKKGNSDGALVDVSQGMCLHTPEYDSLKRIAFRCQVRNVSTANGIGIV